jgi:hypothetical protein
MATVTITIPTGEVPRVQTALSTYFNIPAEDVGVPEIKSLLMTYLRDVVREEERIQARAALMAQAPIVVT